MTTKYIAVYGTLRNDMAANSLMADCTFVETSTIPGKLFLVSSFPGINVEDYPEEDTVVDIYELPFHEGEDIVEGIIERLDLYEGTYNGEEGRDERNLFNRLRCESASGKECWFYEYNYDTEGAQPIPENDFRNYLFNRTVSLIDGEE